MAQEAVRGLFATISGASFELAGDSKPGERQFEAQIELDLGRQRLLCEVRSRAWPNEMHGIAHRLRHRTSQQRERSTPILIAPYFSPQAIETCTELGLSWVDLAGNCEIKITGAYLKVRGNPNPFKLSRGTATLYSPKSANVVHALLLQPHRKWTTEALARVAGVSLGQVAGVKKLLERNHWIRAAYGETTLIEPRKLLDDWSLHYRPKRAVIRLFTLDSANRLEARIASAIPDYAFTEFSAANLYAPHTRHQRVALSVPQWQADQALALGLKGGEGAANVAVYETGERSEFVELHNGSRCVSPILAYLDLKVLAGRGQDAAEHLLETVIEPRWK